MLETPWQCSTCKIEVILSPIEKLQHQVSCQKSNTDMSSSSAQTTHVTKPNSKAFDCSECGKTLHLTPIEILRHKKDHSKS